MVFNVHKRQGSYGHINFDGSDDYIGFSWPSPLDFQTGSQFSIAAWVKWSTVGASNNCIISTIDYPSGGSGWYFGASNAAAGDIVLHMANVGFSVTLDKSSVGGLNDGKWHRVVATYDGSGISTGINLYAEGQLLPVGTVNNGVPGTLTNTVISIGILTSTTTFAPGLLNWNGQMDDISIWSQELTPNLVQQDYNLSRQGYPGVLNRVPWWAYSSLASGGAFAQLQFLD